MSGRETLHFTVPGGLRVVADAMGPADAQPVLLLHGGGQTRGSWRDTVEVVAERGYRTYALDARGHGDSDHSPQGDYTPDAFTSDLRDIIRQVGGETIVIGASLGGIVGLLVAGENGPPIIRALAMVDVAARTNPYGVKRIHEFMRANSGGFASIDEAADAVAAFSTDRPRPRNTGGLARNLREVNGRLYWHWDPRFMDSWHPAHRAAAGRLEDAARALTIPALLVHAAHSDVLGQDEIDHLRGLVAHLQYIRVANASHMVVGDRNSDFNRAILDFLDASAAPGKP